MKLAQTIKTMRRELCLSQQEFARLVGLTNTSISNYEHGKVVPSYPTIRKLRDLARERGITVPEISDFIDS